MQRVTSLLLLLNNLVWIYKEFMVRHFSVSSFLFLEIREMKKEELPAHHKYAELLREFSPKARKEMDIIERVDKKIYPVFEDLVDHLVTDIYGFAYKRPHLDIKTRHLISLGVLSAMGDCRGQLRFQLKAGLNLGIAPDVIKEVFIQVAVFAGNARAINAAQIFHKILKKRNVADEETK